jgi:hypothetical protein
MRFWRTKSASISELVVHAQHQVVSLYRFRQRLLAFFVVAAKCVQYRNEHYFPLHG